MGVDVRESLQAASIGELAWLDLATGAPAAEPVTPLLLGDEPAIAFPYAHAARAHQVASARAVAVVVSDDRMTGRGWQPLAVSGRPRLLADPEGELFGDELLDQELRKYPPARTLIDSPLLRREHWWYVPRLIVAVTVESVRPVAARASGAGEVLVVAADDQLSIETVRRVEEYGDQLKLARIADSADLAGELGREIPAGPAILLGHDFSAPDLECWTPWTTAGWLRDGSLTVEQRPSRTALEPPPKLWQRLWRHHRLGRACRQALAAHAEQPSPR